MYRKLIRNYRFYYFIGLIVLAGLLVGGLPDKVHADEPVAVIVAPAANTNIDALAADYGATVDQSIPSLGLFHVVGSDPNLLTLLASDGRVTAVYPDSIIESQPRFIGEVGNELDAQLWNGQSPYTVFSNQWAVSTIRLTPAQNISQGQGIVVAVLDSGVDPNHSLLVGHLVAGFDFVDNDSSPLETRDGIDEDGDGTVDEGAGHGTHVAGIVRLAAPQASIMPLRIFDDDGQSSYFAAAAAIVYAVDNGAGVINLSGSGLDDLPFFAQAVAYAQTHDVAVVAAGGANVLGYPASYPSVVSVGASDQMDNLTDFSNFIQMGDTIYAPGVSIFSAYDAGQYAWWTGNSMATPFVAGTAALMRAAGPCDASCVHTNILNTAHPVVTDPETQVKYGRLDAFDAVAAAANQSQTSLVVELKDGDSSQPDPYHIRPHLNIINNGNSIPLSALTLRYWYTAGANVSQQFDCDYAEISCAGVTGSIGAAPNTSGADTYMELHFTEAAGMLFGGEQTGPMQLRLHKTSWAPYYEWDDYSYNGSSTYTPSQQVTLYYNGQLIWGTEPAGAPPVSSSPSLKVQYRAADTQAFNQEMKPHLKIINTGSTPVSLSTLTIRYWFMDTTTIATQFNCDYAVMGCQHITAVFGSDGYHRYMELHFDNYAPSIGAGGQSGEMQIRLNHSNWSNYNETDDFSFAPNLTTFNDWQHVTLYQNGQLIWGQEP